MKTILPTLLVSVIALGTGCQSVRDQAYYGAMERFGVQKREILVDRVEEAQKSQQQAAAEFTDALQAFMAVVDVEPSKLENMYNRLNRQFNDAQRRASAVTSRIDAVQRVAGDLFDEWEAELDKYSRSDLRQASERQLRETRGEYNKLIAAMERAESRMSPVLEAFEDQILFLKHNLNAMAIASLKNEVGAVEREVQALIEEMNNAIREAEGFIAQMKG